MLGGVLVTAEVMNACWTHAHSNEKEEVMGLLIGQIVDSNDGAEILKITAVKVIRRLTKQRDRVEIEDNQLMQAAEFAETLEGEDGEKLRVLGWYHSHPHITVWPSHVDLRTQANYQGMDGNFVGLIFSVFNYDANTGIDTREVTAFQTEMEDGNYTRREVPLYILKNHKTNANTEAHVIDAMTSLPTILKEEEKEELNKSSSGADIITKVHNQAVITANLTKHHSLITAPLLDTLRAKIQHSKERTAHLREIRDKLLEEIRIRDENREEDEVNENGHMEVHLKDEENTPNPELVQDISTSPGPKSGSPVCNKYSLNLKAMFKPKDMTKDQLEWEKDLDINQPITAGVEEQVHEVIHKIFNEFEDTVEGPRMATFQKIWRETSFGLIFHGRDSFMELYTFSEEMLDIVKQFAVKTRQKADNPEVLRYAALYLLYALYFKQPCRPMVKIRLTLEEFEEMLELFEDAKHGNHYDVVYAWAKLFSDGAFHYVAAPGHLGIELALQLEQKEIRAKYPKKNGKQDFLSSVLFKSLKNNVMHSHEKYEKVKKEFIETNPQSKSLLCLNGTEQDFPSKLLSIVEEKKSSQSSNDAEKDEDIGEKRRRIKNKFCEVESYRDQILAEREKRANNSTGRGGRGGKRGTARGKRGRGIQGRGRGNTSNGNDGGNVNDMIDVEGILEASSGEQVGQMSQGGGRNHVGEKMEKAKTKRKNKLGMWGNAIIRNPPQEEKVEQEPEFRMPVCWNFSRLVPSDLHGFNHLSVNTLSGPKQPEKSHNQLMRPKQDHKRKFQSGIPERQRMTMFDLIYYNPEHGKRMSTDEPEANADDIIEMEAEEVVKNGPDEPVQVANVQEEDGNETPGDEDNAMPVPQVKVGPNGELILDEASTVVETTQAKKAKEDLQNSPLVFENSNRATNYGTWSKKRKHSDWSNKETLKFYRALSVVGTDFSMMASLFSTKTRQELKLKFKKEEKINGAMIDRCLKQQGQYTDLQEFDEDSEEDDDPPIVQKRARQKSKPKKLRAGTRRIIKDRGYYSSSDAEDDNESPVKPSSRFVHLPLAGICQRPATAPSPALQGRPHTISVVRANSDVGSDHSPHRAASPLLQNLLSRPQPQTEGGAGSAPQFPPGLLAANPGLSGVKPGSLVVVASPSKTDPSSQLLHVYMGSPKNRVASASAALDEVINTNSGLVRSRPNMSPRPASRSPSPLSRPPLSLAPLSESSPTPSRKRTVSESSASSISPTRKRTLSGTLEPGSSVSSTSQLMQSEHFTFFFR